MEQMRRLERLCIGRLRVCMNVVEEKKKVRWNVLIAFRTGTHAQDTGHEFRVHDLYPQGR